MTLEEHNSRKSKTYKMLLIFGMISILMIFAGLTSAYVVSKSRPDWLSDFELPNAFLMSTIVMILSSATFILALKSIKKANRNLTTIFLITTFLLGVLFVVLQFKGFGQVIDSGYFFTGSESSVTTSFLYIVVLVHMAHLLGGFISLIVVIYNHYKQKYNASQTLGIELSAMYWHFMDFIWVYLFLFFYFFK
ncbi:cytochrome c oxidase subunit 3 [Flavobacterium sediminilitoris]|uniref:Cytochrome c oxidase subunit 3 n=2 Tax=Flavobacteriaceae TaxID=49546 RepID=A0ABY4HV43_9FLAO|nr:MULTISPECIES: cytochrome c oxidase subunit 3 [Flavobacterium]UOX35409.1 cytochrome c oxidase subunit 3 [Flavobacterium sediminilitoris]